MKTIYLDNAATTLKKPQSVKEAVINAMDNLGSDGRGVNSFSLGAARNIYAVRDKLNDLFDGYGAEYAAFANNATTALNTAINGLINNGDTVVTTVTEHNSVLRPLYRLKSEKNISLKIIGLKDGILDYDGLKAAIEKRPEAVIVTHASNLTGMINDIGYIGSICRQNGAKFIVDCAQTAGILPISMKNSFIDILCFTGHKGLYGPQGTGGLLINPDIKLRPLTVGGSGIMTFSTTHPDIMPTALEAGTLNTPGICGLGAGIDFINETGLENIFGRITALTERFSEGIKDIENITVYKSGAKRVGTVALNINGADSAIVGNLLSEAGIAIRSGGHCAPLMHRAIGTESCGAVRFSFSYFTDESDIDCAVNVLHDIAKEF